MSFPAVRGDPVTTSRPAETAPLPIARRQGTRPPVILVVEDNPADADLIREALEGSAYDTELRDVRDGQAALDFLRHETPFEDAPTPDLILLDLNMPGLDGRAVLAIVKHDPELRHIPVVVFSGSSAPDDVLCAYELRANCYVTKPVGLRQFMAALRAIERFWVGVACLPSQQAPVA